MYQQGDCLLKPVDTIPTRAKHLKGETVLHHGATGNHHTLKGSFAIFHDGESKYLEVVEPTEFSHEEHKTFTIEPGKYALHFVQEFDHFADLQRAVVD